MIIADAGIFFGRFHPLLVHLPIGFLLLAVILAILGRNEKYRSIQPAVTFSLFAGTICAVLACITGYLLSFSGDYNQDVLNVHMWGGLGTAAVSGLACLVSSRKVSIKFFQTGKALLVILSVMVVMISVTGHFGGTLTHGSGYISPDILFGNTEKKVQVTDINEAFLYEDLVQPILAKKCSNCHNSFKKKGELSMESYKALLKGGKHGVVVEAGNANKSELVKRVLLDPKDEKFMPADGKPALSEAERNIVTWWIEKAAAGSESKLKETVATLAIRKDISEYLGLETNGVANETATDSSDKFFVQLQLAEISASQVTRLKQAGFVVKYLHLKPVLLDVTLPENSAATSTGISEKLKELLQVKDHIIWLNVAGNNIIDSHLELIGQLKNLQRLRLDKNPVTDAGVAKLHNLAFLESINLYNTKVSAQSLRALSSNVKLKHLYVWGTGIKPEQAPVNADSTVKIIAGVN